MSSTDHVVSVDDGIVQRVHGVAGGGHAAPADLQQGADEMEAVDVTSPPSLTPTPTTGTSGGSGRS